MYDLLCSSFGGLKKVYDYRQYGMYDPLCSSFSRSKKDYSYRHLVCLYCSKSSACRLI